LQGIQVSTSRFMGNRYIQLYISANPVICLRRLAYLGILVVVLVIASGIMVFHKYGGNEEQLVVFHAGSLTNFIDLAKTPLGRKGIGIANEPSGSVMVARKIVDLGKNCDVALFADYRLVPLMLFPTGKADWVVLFASNELVLVYTNKSRGAGEINSGNWLDIVMRPGVRIGFSNPNTDPAGYRAVMALGLASLYYRSDKPLKLLENYAGINASRSNGKLILDARSINPSPSKIVVRDKSVDLIALVEEGIIDYAFEYKSVAVSLKLRYVELPSKLNLAEPGLSNWYSQVEVMIRGVKGESKMLTASPIIYGATIPSTAKHPEAARTFMEFLLSPEGRRLLAEAGFKPLEPPILLARKGAEPPQWLVSRAEIQPSQHLAPTS